MISSALDSNNDLIITNGRTVNVSGAAQVVQQVRCRLLFYQGEWFLNRESGTPYFQEIFTKPVNLAAVESILKERIVLTNGVNELIDFSMTFDKSIRRLVVTYRANTIYGEIDSNEVLING